MFNIYIMLQSPCIAIKPAVIPKKRKFSNVSLESVDSLDNNLSFPKKDTFSSVPVRCQTSESEISTEQTTEGILIQFNSIGYGQYYLYCLCDVCVICILVFSERDSSTTVELAERQNTPVSPIRPDVEITTANVSVSLLLGVS